VSDQTPSGNRWEPASPVAMGEPEPPPRSGRGIDWSSNPRLASGSRRTRWVAASAALFLGSAVGGYALGHDRSEDAPVQGVTTDQGPGPAFGVPGTSRPDAGTGADEDDRRNPASGENQGATSGGLGRDIVLRPSAGEDA
jgi:hypothetical protein